jgi:hypothetical protein
MSGTRKLAAILVSDVGLEPTCQEGLQLFRVKLSGTIFPYLWRKRRNGISCPDAT